jgi:alpha-mannosidase
MSTGNRLTFHLLPNAHLDPVWFWDWREGLNEGIITVRTVLDLMDEFPELTFIRGESAIYEHIQRSAPGLFQRILSRMEEGRWDVVGGTVIQPDTNLVSTEVLCREFERGLDYFEKNLHVRPTVAWLADSFGHSGGLPNILAAFGMEGFAFTRPQREQFAMDAPAFWWEGGGRNRILCYRQHWRWYNNERDNMNDVLDTTLRDSRKQKLVNVGVLCGLGNHGGGPTRRHLRDIEQWRRDHPEVEVRFSTLHGFFDELKREIHCVPGGIPAARGEFGYCLRGCYSSVQKFKSIYRQGEAQVATAEITRSVIGAVTDTRQGSLDEAWDALAFNAFHDILPGSSIERALNEQTAWIGLALHRAQSVKFAALNQLAARVDTSVPVARHPDHPTDVPLLVWNPLPRPFKGQVELEASLDYRPIWAFKDRADEMPVVVYDHAGKPAAFQTVETEHTSMPDLPWRRRVVAPLEIPALGWTMVRLGWREQHEAAHAVPPVRHSRPALNPRITNGKWNLEVKSGAVRIQRNGVDFFSSKRNIEIRTFEDPWGSWGGMNEEKDSYCLEELREVWELVQSEILESGPLRE